MSNPATDEPTAWDQPLPDLTGIEWGELPRMGSRPAFESVRVELEKRSRARKWMVSYYEDSP